MIRFAIVGGGVSGCFLAHLLKSHKNISVTLFEKSRGLGGRCSVKRHEEYGSFNMGAPFFTNKNPELSSFFSFLINKSFISTLDHPIGYCHFNGSFREAHKKERFVGKPEMNSFLKKWADESTLVLKTEIKNIDFKKSKWVLEDQDKRRYPEFDVCVIALPSEQGKFLWRTHS